MNKEIEEARAHKKQREDCEARVRALSDELTKQGYAFMVTVARPDSTVTAFSMYGPTNLLAQMTGIMVTRVTDKFSEEIRSKSREIKQMKSAGPTWEPDDTP